MTAQRVYSECTPTAQSVKSLCSHCLVLKSLHSHCTVTVTAQLLQQPLQQPPATAACNSRLQQPPATAACNSRLQQPQITGDKRQDSLPRFNPPVPLTALPKSDADRLALVMRSLSKSALDSVDGANGENGVVGTSISSTRQSGGRKPWSLASRAT